MYSFPTLERPAIDPAPTPRRGLLGRARRALLVASLLAGAAAGGLWWRGASHADYIGWSGGDVHVGLLNEDGIVRLEWTSDQAVPPGWRTVSMPPTARLHGWQSSWEGDLNAATRLGGCYGVAWRVWRTGRGPFVHGDRPRRSLYLSHPFLLGAALSVPVLYVAWQLATAVRRQRRDDEEMA